MAIDFSALELALKSFEEALEPPPRNERERDGAIQRFEYTFELTWKTAMRVLSDSGVISTSPKSVIRDLGQQGWIDDVELWLAFLRARNATVHTYRGSTADGVFKVARTFPSACRKLIVVLKGK